MLAVLWTILAVEVGGTGQFRGFRPHQGHYWLAVAQPPETRCTRYLVSARTERRMKGPIAQHHVSFISLDQHELPSAVQRLHTSPTTDIDTPPPAW